LVILDGEDAAVGDGDAVDVAGQVVEDLLGALTRRLAVDDPVLLPDGRGDLQVRQQLCPAVSERSSEDPG
jgi:hypothetical protein